MLELNGAFLIKYRKQYHKFCIPADKKLGRKFGVFTWFELVLFYCCCTEPAAGIYASTSEGDGERCETATSDSAAGI